MNNKKYKLINKTFFHSLNRELYQVEALRDFGYVETGDIGGWVEGEKNLSQSGDCWVRDTAQVFGDAKVAEDAQVFGDAQVFDQAQVYGRARVFEHAQVSGDAEVCDNAEVYGDACVFGDAKVCDNAEVYGDAIVHENASVKNNATVRGHADVCGDATVKDDATVSGHAEVLGDAVIAQDSLIRGNSRVTKNSEVLTAGPLGEVQRYVECTPDKNTRKMQISCGCFLGGIEEFAQAISEASETDNTDFLLLLPLLRKKEQEWVEEGNYLPL